MAVWDRVHCLFSGRRVARGTDTQLKNESKKLGNCKYPITKDLLQIEEKTQNHSPNDIKKLTNKKKFINHCGLASFNRKKPGGFANTQNWDSKVTFFLAFEDGSTPPGLFWRMELQL